MTTIEMIQAVVIGYATVWAFYLLLFPALASIWRPRAKTMTRTSGVESPTMAIIIPARNAASVIARCLGSLQMCNYPRERVDTYVVADHCADETAECAQAAGATALVRREEPAGKTYALAWAMGKLTERGVTPDLYVIVDTTVQVEANFLASLADCWRQGEDIVTDHPVLSPENQAWYARCLGLMIVHRNLQNWSRERLRLSALLDGRGMAYSRTYIRRFGWSLALPASSRGRHPTEDWRHAIRAVEQGYRVAFAQEARVVMLLTHSLIEATKQGSRWERGRLINASTYAVRVLMRGLRQRDRLKICAALDAIQPPVAVLGGLSSALAATAAIITGTSTMRIASLIPFSLVVLYGLGVTLRGRQEGISLGSIVWAPVYIAWRCSTFLFAWGFLDRFDPHARQKNVVDHLECGRSPRAR